MSNRTTISFALAILFLTSLGAAAQSTNRADAISSRLTTFEQNHPTEKAYLQLDKPYYASGDTIYFKAYVTAGELHKLSSLSGVLQVELINTKNKIDQSIKLQLDTGIAWGDFALPDSLPAGNYRVRAYTRWMRNAGDSSFFERIIPVEAAKPAKIPESLAKRTGPPTQADIQFLPESGMLIAGINNKIAFKAIGPGGLGITAKGVVEDSDGKQVAAFASRHLGMGYFYLKPEPGKTYSAKVIYANGGQNVIALPKQADGIALSVSNDSIPKATVSVIASGAYFRQNKGKAYTLLIASGGLITTVNCKLDSNVISLDILKRKLRTGIATVTLFSEANEPLAERLFFVQNYDQLGLQLNTEKKSYAGREKVSVNIKAINRRGEPGVGHFSVSVINENIVPAIEPEADNILTNLLLTSDMKGLIEQPGYYFSDTAAAVRENLDLLMLTQGYRRFEWRQVLDTSRNAPTFQPEYGITIAGRVDNLFNKPIANTSINLIRLGSGFVSASTDGKGLFRFDRLAFLDTARFILNATNGKGKSSVKISLFKDEIPAVADFHPASVADTGINLSAYAENEQSELAEVRTEFPGKVHMLKEVNIHNTPLDNKYRTDSFAGAGNADQVMHADEIERIHGPLKTSLNGRLRGIVFMGREANIPYLNVNLYSRIGANAAKPMLIIVDGVYSNADELNFLNAEDVETVEVLKYASASIYGAAGGGGVLVITTKRTRQLKPNEIASMGVLPVNMMGFYKARIFYAPQYDIPEALAGKHRDLRSTICWQPEIKTDKDGNAELEYYNADLPGTYKVTIEGIDKDGNIGRQVYRYEVK